MDNYTKGMRLGRGAFGEALLVKHKLTGELRVIKVTDIVERAETEVSLLSSLNHPNIVKYYHSFEEDASLHIVMEYCDGGDLDATIKSKSLREDEIWQCIGQLCAAIKYLHDNHILHRDLKPNNVFLTMEGMVKLGDFGLSKRLEGEMYVAKTAVGCWCYIPPEMCDRKPYSYSCDMWGLGCILYEMAARKPPYSRGDVVQHFDKGEPRPLVEQLPDNWTPELRQLVDALLELDPESRITINGVLNFLAQKGLCSDYTSLGTSASTSFGTSASTLWGTSAVNLMASQGGGGWNQPYGNQANWGGGGGGYMSYQAGIYQEGWAGIYDGGSGGGVSANGWHCGVAWNQNNYGGY